MAKNMTSNKEVVKSEVNFLLSRLRGAIAYEGKDKCSVYLAGVHKETYETLTSMGIKWDVKRWCTFLFAPKKGTKAYTALFNGSKVLDEAKAYKEAKVAAAKAEKEEKAAKAKAKAEKKAAKEKEVKAEKKAKAEKAAAKTEKKVAAKAEKKVVKTAAKAEKPKTEKKATKAAPKAEKKAKAEKAAAPKAEKPKAEKKADAKAEKPKKSATVKKSAAEKPAVNEVAPEPSKTEEKAEA